MSTALANVEALAKLHAKEALAVHVEIMRDTSNKPADRAKSAEAVLNRAHGTPTRAIVYVPAKQKVAQALATMSDAELLAAAEEARAQRKSDDEQEASDMRQAEAECASEPNGSPLYRSRDGRRALPFSLTEDEITDVDPAD